MPGTKNGDAFVRVKELLAPWALSAGLLEEGVLDEPTLGVVEAGYRQIRGWLEPLSIDGLVRVLEVPLSPGSRFHELLICTPASMHVCVSPLGPVGPWEAGLRMESAGQARYLVWDGSVWLMTTAIQGATVAGVQLLPLDEERFFEALDWLLRGAAKGAEDSLAFVSR